MELLDWGLEGGIVEVVVEFFKEPLPLEHQVLGPGMAGGGDSELLVVEGDRTSVLGNGVANDRLPMGGDAL